MDCNHSFFGRKFHLLELLYYLAIGRVTEKNDARGSYPPSGILLSRLDANGDFFHSIQCDDRPKNRGSHLSGAPFGLDHRTAMISHQSVNSSGSFADAEHARLQFEIVRKHGVVETDDSLVLTDRAAFQQFQN